MELMTVDLLMYNLPTLITAIILLATLFLQWYLSNRENWYAGLIPPILSFIYSLFYLMVIEDLNPFTYPDGLTAFLFLIVLNNIFTYLLIGLHIGVRGLKGW